MNISDVNERQMMQILRYVHDFVTHGDIFLSRAGLAPGGQRVNRNQIGLKFTVGVCENSSEFRDQFCRPVLEWSQKDSLWVVIIGMNVVPNHRRSLENSRHLIDGRHTDVIRHDLWP